MSAMFFVLKDHSTQCTVTVIKQEFHRFSDVTYNKPMSVPT